MTETKAKKLIVAGTVGAVLFAVILLSVLLYQLLTISTYNKRIEKLEQNIARYEMLIVEAKDTKEVVELRAWIEREARKLGYVYKDELG